MDSDAEIRRRVEQRLNKRKEFLIHLMVFSAINLGVWAVWWFFTRGFAPWPLLLSLPWGAGLAAHFIDTYEQVSSARAAVRERAVREEMQQVFGEDWNEDASEDDYQRTRQRVEKRFNKNKEFQMHLSVYVPINLLVWLIWLVLGPAGLPWPALVSVGWGIGLIAHAVDAYMGADTMREKTIQREIARERDRMYGVEKTKRKRERLALSDDGELVEIVEDEWEEDKRKREI